MIESILTSVKKVLGLDEEYTAFDEDVIMHINSTFGTLQQLGVGPESGFMITDKSTEWTAFLDNDPRYNLVKSYVYIQVRLLFDPPSTGYVITAFEKQRDELAWRINMMHEQIDNPVVEETPVVQDIFEGG